MLLLLHLCLLLKGDGSHGVLSPFEGDVWQRSTAHAGEDHGHHVRRNATLQGFTQDVLLDFALLKLEALLLGFLLFLLSPLLLGFGLQPIAHRLLGAMPLRGCSRQLAN